MKKIGLLLSAIIVLATSCADKNAYTITGKVANADANGKQVFLQKLGEDGRSFVSMDTATVENGAFVFTGKADTVPAIRFVKLSDDLVMPALVILEAGKIELNIDTVSSVKGTALNDQYQAFATKSNEINNKMRKLGDEYRNASIAGTLTPEQETRINTEYDSLTDELTASMFDFTKSNIKNPVGEFFFLTFGSAFDETQAKDLLGSVSDKFKENEQVKHLVAHFEKLEATAVGKQFVDVKGFTPEGKEVSLSAYAGKGKVVLVDFWASWCGPCKQEMPNVVAAYAKYKDKGFEIVGISLDQDGEAWKGAIKDLKITWPQMSDLKGWQSELSAPYAVTSIPYTLLLDKDGKIIEKNLRGEELLSKLDTLLK
ncbi:MAG: redoxin family protein [Dysgonomonas sp.]